MTNSPVTVKLVGIYGDHITLELTHCDTLFGQTRTSVIEMHLGETLKLYLEGGEDQGLAFFSQL